MHRAPQPRRLRTQAAILDVARDVARAQGYGALRADALARAAGVAKGTIFAHYPDMDHLRAALVAERLRPLCDLPPIDDIAGLQGALGPAFALMVSDAHVLAAISRFSGSEGAGLGMAEAICHLHAKLAQAIAGLQARGRAASGDPALLADGVLAFAFHAAGTALCADGPGLAPARAMLDALVARWLTVP